MQRRVAFATMSLAAVFGCKAQNPSAGSVQPTVDPGRKFEVESPTGRLQGWFPAQLNAFLGTKRRELSFTFAVEDKGGSVYLNSMLPLDSAFPGSTTIRVTEGAMAPGMANIKMIGVDNSPDLGNATVSLAINPGRVEGEIVFTRGSPHWRFGGQLLVECWVPPSALPASEQNGSVTGPTETLSRDLRLETPQCAPFRALGLP